MESKNVVKEDVHGNDVQVRQGLTKDDWELTLSQLKSQLVSNKLQVAVISASIRQVEEELTLYD